MRIIFAWIFLVTFLGTACAATPPPPVTSDWKKDWQVEAGFAMIPDTTGYHYPTAIALVPTPGTGVNDPLYFVTEIAGAVKVVTNANKVYSFAEGFAHVTRDKELPSVEGQNGTAGICLEPKHGYIYVTFITQDADGVYRNRIIRFETQPGTFSLSPAKSTLIAVPFEGDRLGRIGHQIGPCRIQDDLIYIGIGDGLRGAQINRLDTLLGKIIRMTLDGLPAPGNPYRVDDDPKKPANFIWAQGFRHPFSLDLVGDRVFAADNGNNIDRFVQVVKGGNYFWDGGDWSIGTNADAIFAPSIAPAQMEYLSPDSAIFPKPYAGTFFLTGAAYHDDKRTGVVLLPYDLGANRLNQPPRYFLRYRGTAPQALTGLAFGRGGLYLAPVLPNLEGVWTIFRIVYQPNDPHPYTLAEPNVGAVLSSKGCRGCHALGGSAGVEGPPLDAAELIPRLQARLQADAYRARVEMLAQVNEEPFARFRAARQQVLAARGAAQMRLWLTNFLQEPRFDNPDARMPNPSLAPAEAQAMADYLLTAEPENRILSVWWQIVSVLQSHLLILMATCIALGAIAMAGANSWLQKAQRK